MARTNTNSGSGGGVTNVTASLPLTSSGGATPNIAINQPSDNLIWFTDPVTHRLTGSSHLAFFESIGQGQLKVGNMFLWMKTNNGGLDPADLWIGESAGRAAATSIAGRNTGVGYFVGSSLTTGSNNSFFGQAAGYLVDTGSNNSFFGSSSGRFTTTGHENTYVGEEAGYSNVSGQLNTFVGYKSGYGGLGSTANHGAFIGAQSGESITTGSGNVFSGFQSGQATTTGGFNVFSGFQSGVLNTTGDHNVFSGIQSGATNVTGTGLVLIGANADISADGWVDSIGIGRGVSITASNQLLFGSNAHPIYDVRIGDYTNVTNGTYFSISDSTQAITFHYGVGAGTFYTLPIGDGAPGDSLTTNGAGQLVWAVVGGGGTPLIGQTSSLVSAPAPGPTFEVWLGFNAGGGGASIVATTFVGYGAGNNATAAGQATFIGEASGANATSAAGGTFFGAAAGLNAANAFNSTFIGLMTGQDAINASESMFLGGNAGNAATNAAQSTFIGASAGAGATDANRTIYIGFQTGMNDTVNNAGGSHSIVIGDGGSTGAFVNSVGIGTGVVNTAANQFLVQAPGAPFTDIAFDSTTGTFRAGALTGGNGTVFSIFDTRRGFNFATLQDFANNAAAIVGGLAVGDLYYTNVAGDGVVKVVI